MVSWCNVRLCRAYWTQKYVQYEEYVVGQQCHITRDETGMHICTYIHVFFLCVRVHVSTCECACFYM